MSSSSSSSPLSPSAGGSKILGSAAPPAASAAGPLPPSSPRTAGGAVVGSPRARPAMLLQGALPVQGSMVDRLPSPPSTFASTSGAGGLGGSVQSCFSDSESDASGSSKEGLDDSSSLHTVKSGAVVRVVKRSPSSLQRIETFLSAKGRSLSRGLSRQPSASGRSSSISSKGGMMMMMNASTGAGQSRTNNNPLATSTSSTGGPILPPPSPGTTRGAAATTIAATTVAAAAAVVTTAAPPSPRASAPLPLPPQQQPPSPGRSQQQQQQVGSAPPPSLAATTGGGSSTASLSGLAASVGGLLLGRSLAEEAPEGLRQQGSVSVLASSTGKPSVAPSASPRQQSLGLGLGLGEEEKGGSGKASSSSYGSGGGIGGDGDLAASLLALGGGLMDAGFAFLSPKTPTPEEQKALQLLARRLVVKPTADAEGDAPAAGFDLTAEPRRALLLDGLLDKIGTEARIKRTNRRRLLLFSDVLLMAEPPLEPGNEQERIFVKQVIDLHKAAIADRSGLGEPLTFEVLGPKRGWRFVADGKEQHALWLQQLRRAVLGLAQDSPASERLGWQHRLYRGTLFSAALEGDVPQLEALLAHHRRVAKESQQQPSQKGHDEDEEGEEEEEAAELLAASDEWGLRPVHYAAAEGQEEALLFLLDRGGEASPPSDTLDTPLHYAASQGQDQAVVRLLQKGADPHAHNFQDRTSLFEAAAACDTLGERAERIVALLHQSAGADLQTVDASGNTPLHKACAAAAVAAAAIDAEDQDARLHNTLGMVRLLTRLGASPNAPRGTDGLTPLQLACGAEGEAPAAEGVLLLLLQAGAAPNGNARGARPLELLLTPRFFDSGDPNDAASSASTNAATAVASSVASAASSLLSPVLGENKGGQSGGAATGEDALDNAVAKEVLALRLPHILTLLRHGGRLATKKLAKQGIDPALISQMAQAQAEWEAKALATPTTSKPAVVDACAAAFSSTKGGGGAVTSPMNASMNGSVTELGDAGAVAGGDAGSNTATTTAISGSSSKACPLCAAPFTLLFRRHHCRCCGGLACALCSSKKLAVVKPAPKAPATTSSSTTATPLSFERACDACFNSAHHQATQIRKEEDDAMAAIAIATVDTTKATKQEQQREQEREHARNQAELGILNPSGRTSADPLGTRRAGVAGAPGGRVGNVPASGLPARTLGAVAQTQNVMAENMQLMADRGEKLNRLAERTRGMQQNAMDFKEAAKALAEREKNRKWWEL